MAFNGTNATQNENTITFDATTYTSAITGAMLVDGSTAGDAELTGFGPIDTVDFAGFQQANLNLGQYKNTLTIAVDIANLSVNTDQKVINPTLGTLSDDSSNQGDNTITIDEIGYSYVPGAVDQINGGLGSNAVSVVFGVEPNDPSRINLTPSSLDNIAQSLDYLTQVSLTAVQSLTINNSGNTSSTGVAWTAGNGEVAAAIPTPREAARRTQRQSLAIEGVGSVQIIGGTGPNTLSAVTPARPRAPSAATT